MTTHLLVTSLAALLSGLLLAPLFWGARASRRRESLRRWLLLRTTSKRVAPVLGRHYRAGAEPPQLTPLEPLEEEPTRMAFRDFYGDSNVQQRGEGRWLWRARKPSPRAHKRPLPTERRY